MVKDGRAVSSSDEDFKQLEDDSDGDRPEEFGRADSSSDDDEPDEFGLADDSDGVEPQPQPQPQPKVAAQKP